MRKVKNLSSGAFNPSFFSKIVFEKHLPLEYCKILVKSPRDQTQAQPSRLQLRHKVKQSRKVSEPCRKKSRTFASPKSGNA